MPADPGFPRACRPAAARDGAAALLHADRRAAGRGRGARDAAHGTRITYSPKVFIPLTMLCRDRCGYCTFAKAPARLESPYLSLDDVLAIARAGRQAGCHEALFTLGEGPEDRYPAARAWLSEHGFTSTVDYLAQACRLVVEETGLLPHANAGALGTDELAALRPVSASQGMMLESLDPDLACHRGAPDKTPERRLATLEAAGELAIPFTTGLLVGIGESRADRLATLEAIVASHRRHGHVQEVIVQNFLPKPGTAMHRSPACPTDEFLWTIAIARLVLPTDIHLQAPPNLSDDLAPLVASGIDDWGGVSPVTADHVNPERAWPALGILRAATEAAGYTLAPRLTLYPEFATDPEQWLSESMRFPVLDASDAEGLGRDHPWCSGGEFPPPLVGGGRIRPPPVPALDRHGWPHRCARLRQRGGRGAGRRGPGPGARRGRDRHAVLGTRPRGARRGRGRRPGAARRGGRRRHVGGQPQHQLHQRVHLQVPLLRLLQRPALAEPTGCSVSSRVERHHRARRRGRGRRGHRGVPARRHPPQLRRRLLPRGDPGRAPGVGPDPHPWVHRPGGDRRGTTPGRGPRRLSPPPARGRVGHPAGDRGGDPRRRGPRRAVSGQDQHRAVARGPPVRAPGRTALQRDHHVRRDRASPFVGAALGAHPGPAGGDRGLHRVRAPALRAHGHAPLPATQGTPRADVPRDAAHARRRAHRLPGVDLEHPGELGEDGRRGCPSAPRGRRQRSGWDPDGREHLPGGGGQPRPAHGRRGLRRPRRAARPAPRAAHDALRSRARPLHREHPLGARRPTPIEPSSRRSSPTTAGLEGIDARRAARPRRAEPRRPVARTPAASPRSATCTDRSWAPSSISPRSAPTPST